MLRVLPQQESAFRYIVRGSEGSRLGNHTLTPAFEELEGKTEGDQAVDKWSERKSSDHGPACVFLKKHPVAVDNAGHGWREKAERCRRRSAYVMAHEAWRNRSD
jgi:hypothetical protein